MSEETNYNRKSHIHCFENPKNPCGFKGHHCCLCDIVTSGDSASPTWQEKEGVADDLMKYLLDEEMMIEFLKIKPTALIRFSELFFSRLELARKEEREKVSHFYKMTKTGKLGRSDMKKAYDTARSQAFEEVEQMLKNMEAKRPTRTLEDLANGLRKLESMFEPEKQHIRNKDNGFYIENVECVVKNKTLSDALTSLAALKDKKV